MIRYLAPLLFASAAFAADARTAALEAIAPLVAALSEGDAVAFMRPIVSEFPDRRDLQNNVTALLQHADITSSVDFLKLESDLYELDWYMQVRAKATGSIIERRRGVVRMRLSSRGKLRTLEPVSFFAPPQLGRAN